MVVSGCGRVRRLLVLGPDPTGGIRRTVRRLGGGAEPGRVWMYAISSQTIPTLYSFSYLVFLFFSAPPSFPGTLPRPHPPPRSVASPVHKAVREDGVNAIQLGELPLALGPTPTCAHTVTYPGGLPGQWRACAALATVDNVRAHKRGAACCRGACPEYVRACGHRHTP